MFKLRTLLAQIVSLSGTYSLFQPLLSRSYGGFILAFHNLKPERFIQHIEALKPNQPVPLSDLIIRAADQKSTSGLFAITFDDGVGETVNTIAEVAVKRNWPVTFFLPTGYLDDTPQGMVFQWWRGSEPFLPRTKIHLPHFGDFDLSSNINQKRFKRYVKNFIYTSPASESGLLISEVVDLLIKNGDAREEWIMPPAPITWDEVSRLSANSFIEFGSHGVSHSPMSSLSLEQLEQELVASKQKISEFTKLPCKHFCYPFGNMASIGHLAPKIVAKHYHSGLTMRRGRIGKHRSFYLLPRIPFYQRDNANMARLKILAR